MLAQGKSEMMMNNVISIEEIIRIGIQKAGGKAALCKGSGVSCATLWRLETGKLKGKPWSRTLGRLTAFALTDSGGEQA